MVRLGVIGINPADAPDTPPPALLDTLSLSHHGGRLLAAAVRFPDAPRPWIDLSTGVNPAPYPAPRTPRSRDARLPEPTETADLAAAAAAAFENPSPGAALPVPGSEAALRVLARLLPARRVLIAGPTYGSHAEAWRAAGAMVGQVPFDQLANADADVLVVVNPNNPDGRVLAPETLRRIGRRQAARARWLVVDEAFADAAPAVSVAPYAGAAEPGLIVLRSFGKFYGLAGVRLGFVLAAPAVLAQLRSVFGDWPVSASAIVAGRAAYRDAAWRDRTISSLNRKSARLDRLLHRAGFEVIGGTPLFRLAAADEASRRFACLAERGVLTRPFDAEPRWLRFGLPAGATAWARLEQALEIRA